MTLASGRQIVVLSPSFSGDSLIGIESSRGPDSLATGRVGLPLADIVEVSIQRVEPLRTTVLVVAIGAAILFGIWVATPW